MSIVAYVDPGTGSIIAATAVAGFAGAAVAVKSRWHSATGKLRPGRKNEGDVADAESEEPASEPVDSTEPTETS